MIQITKNIITSPDRATSTIASMLPCDLEFTIPLPHLYLGKIIIAVFLRVPSWSPAPDRALARNSSVENSRPCFNVLQGELQAEEGSVTLIVGFVTPPKAT